jgi:hypothetical protein
MPRVNQGQRAEDLEVAELNPVAERRSNPPAIVGSRLAAHVCPTQTLPVMLPPLFALQLPSRRWRRAAPD